MTTTTSSVQPSRSVEPGRLWRFGLIAAGTATAANLLLYAVTRTADVSFLVRRTEGADPTEVTAVHVAIMTLVPFLLGLAAAAVAIRRTSHRLRIVAIVGAGVALVSLAGPLSVEADTAAKAILAALHLITGGAFIAALGYVRRA